ncbi:DUF1542 domain-containing protein [Limosilactobacillus walteri]|uniref:DUF1542 domain-containing protein n=1 Tax=Limosilactobacillus walteri TaxID=2268022 RepID=A0ABR8P5J2_9LACO|nr:DUF1542 domain-containing protein [Limosilactobacillus walteri]MBD5805603.1 DUF1542 domain-containing protein [Limosilactobacillus walteri]
MVSKNNRKLIAEKNRKNEKQRFALRKLNVGVASVLLGVTFSIYGGGQMIAHADTTDNGGQTTDTAKVTNEQSPATQLQDTSSTENGQDTNNTVDGTSSSAGTQGGVADANAANAGKDSVEAKITQGEENVTDNDQKQGPKYLIQSQTGTQQPVSNNNEIRTYGSSSPLQGILPSPATTFRSMAVEDPTAIIVTNAQGLIDAIQKGTYTTINIDGDINLGEKTSSNYTNTTINNKRNIVIQAVGDKKTIDFAGYGFNMYSNDYGVTFKNLNLYGQSYYGIVRSAGSYTFDNVDYTGSQLVYTDSGYNATVNFEGTVTSHSVGSYVSPLDGKTRNSQGGNTQQVLQFSAGNNEINFAAGSKVNFTTTNSNVIEIDAGTTVINIKSNPDGTNGAQVTLNPHTQKGPEQLNGMNMDGIARGIASNGNTTLNIDKGANLDIVLKDDAADKYHSSALFLNSGATINDKGSLTVTSVGQPYYRSSGIDAPVYINGNSTINVEGGNFTVNATDLGDYQGNIVTSSGTSTININHHGTFDVTGDGTKATAVSLGSGSTFTSTQPELFSIDMPEGATAIKNGKVSFKGVKTSENGQPIGEIDVTYAADGTPTVTKVTSADRQTVIDTKAAGDAAKNKINLIAAGKEVELTNITFNKDANGDYIMAGNANTADGDGAYVYININGSETPVKVTGSGSQTIYSITNTETEPTATEVPYTVQTGADGKFSVNLGQLKDTDTVSVHADKDFVTSDTDTKTVSKWMLNSYKQQLQDLINEAPTVEGTVNFKDADADKKTAYTDAISAGNTLLANADATAEQIQNQITAITNAKTGLNGESNQLAKARQELQAAVNARSDVEKTPAYYNGSEEAKTAYDNAITAGQDALNKTDATLEDLTNALNDINTAKGNLKGEATNKTALQEAVNNSTSVKESNNYTNADETQKTAYDNAVTAAQTVLEKTNATQAEVNQALENLKTANNNLNGDSKTEAANKAALEAAVNDAPNVRKTSAYYNGSEEAQKAYNDAIAAGQTILDKENPTADEVKTALDAITAAKGNLKGEATNKEALQIAVDGAAGVKNSEDYTNASDTEKQKYDEAITAGQTVLSNSEATQKQVDDAVTAINNAKTALNGSNNLTDAKNKANSAVDTALNNKLTVINESPLTDDEKQKLSDEANADATAAKDAISKATTNDAAAKAGQDGAEKINNITVPTESAVKQAAKDAIDQAAKEKDQAIDNSSLLTDEEKTALKDKVKAAADEAKTNIDNAKTDLAVSQAQTAGETTIKNIEIPTSSKAKDDATAKVDQAVTDKVKDINDNKNLTTEEKADLVKKVNDLADQAKDNIKKATTDEGVREAEQKGVDSIKNLSVPEESAVKEAAKKAIDDATADKTKAINDAPNLTTEEKAKLVDDVNKIANEAKAAIDNATTDAAVTKAQENGVKAIDNVTVPTESAVKQAAKEAVAKTAEAKNNAIDSSNLTDEEKAALKKEVSDAQTAADQAIDNATTNAAVTEAQENGVNTIKGIEVPTKSDAKQQATNDLNTAVDEAKKAIDQDTNLTAEQKQAAKDQIDANAKTAQDAINNAKTNADVTNAVDNGKLAIDKNVANAAIDNAAAGKLKEIKAPLTTDEQKTYTDLINSEANNAKQNIANATTPEEVTTAQNNGVDEINGTNIPTTSKVKEDALNAIKTALDNKTKEINDSQNINAQEKADLIKQAQDAAKTANNNINNATTNAAVETAQTNGEKAIADVTVPNLSDIKQENIDLVNKALDAKKDEIDKASNLSNDEKQKLVNEATNAATDAINNINAAKTNDEAKEAANTGVQNIENVNIPSLDDAKKNAKQAIDDTLKSKVAEINNASNLNPTEKQDLIDKATDAANTAKTNVDKATTNDEAKDAADEGIQTIKGITFTSLDDAKKAANTAIDNALTAKKNEIDAANNLSETEKQKLVDEATQAANTAKENISKAQTNDAVTEAQNKGTEAIANVNVPSLDQAKKDAINAIKQVQAAKNAQIAKADNLNADEQKALTDQVDKIANDAIAEINKPSTTTNDAVAATRDDAIKQITDLFIPTLDGAQTDAINAIESAKNAKIDDINNATHLTDQEKQDLIDQTTKAAKDATDAINAAQNNDAVKDAENAGLNNINKVTIPSLADKQQAAIKELDVARDAKIDAIDGASDLTTDEKNALKDKVQSTYSDAVENVTKSTTDEAVTTAKDNGIEAINGIEVPAKSADKENAKTDLTDAVNKAKEAVDQDSNLTAEEKQAAKDQIDQDAKNAEDAIEKAKNVADVTKAANDGTLAIDKDVANAAIDNAVAGKKAEIAKSSLTDEEKTALNNEVDQKAQDAKEAIKTATTPEAVTSAQESGIKNIENTEVPTVSAVKEAAKKAVADAAAAKNNAIDSSNLTDEEKAALKQQVSAAQNAADSAIDTATTNAAVTEAADNGVKAIDGIEVPTKSTAKDQATADLNKEVDEAKKAIDQDNNLTAEEKQAAKDQIDSDAQQAQEVINNAKTNDDVKKAVDEGRLAIDKDVANAAIDNAVAGKKAEIAKSSLTDEEKAALNNEVDQKAQDAKEAIDAATTDQAVETAKNKGIDSINGVEIPTKSQVKTDAATNIDKAAADAKKAIDNTPDLTNDQKQAAKDQIDQDAKKAKDAIAKATDDKGVQDAADAGLLAINKVTAKAAIDSALATKIAEINNSALTTEEKAALTNQADQAAQTAKNNIDQANTVATVETAKEAGIKQINNIHVPATSAVKDRAIKTINEALSNKINEINNASNITSAEKADLIDQATNLANIAKDNISQATSDEGVATATTAGINAIANVTVPSLDNAKDQAKNLIDDVLNEKKNEINNANNLSDRQKEDLIKQATDAADTAKKNIDNATTNSDVQTAENNGVQAIENVVVPNLDDAKKTSTKVIDDALNEKIAEINNANNLSTAEKDALIKEATSIANTAKDNIAKATTNDAVKDAETAGVKAILNVKVPGREDEQQDAITALDQALANKVNEINNANNLSADAKQALKQQAQAAYTTAVDNVKRAQTNAEINTARDNGVQAILDVLVPTLSDAKSTSIVAVEQVRDAKNTQIDAAKNLTAAQKTELKHQVDSIAKKAIANINSATTDEAVKAAETAGVNEILNLNIPSLDAAKSDAKQAIADALTAKTAEINAAQNLNTTEKQALIDQAQSEAATANQNIDAALTNAAATQAAKNGVQAILGIQVPTVDETRNQADQNIDKALKAKKDEINKSDLSSADKAALINEADQAADNARAVISKATTAAEISNAEAAGIAAIENIKVSSSATEDNSKSSQQPVTETPTGDNKTKQDDSTLRQPATQESNRRGVKGGLTAPASQTNEHATDNNATGQDKLPQTGNETNRDLSVAGLAVASLLGLFGLSGLSKKRD